MKSPHIALQVALCAGAALAVPANADMRTQVGGTWYRAGSVNMLMASSAESIEAALSAPSLESQRQQLGQVATALREGAGREDASYRQLQSDWVKLEAATEELRAKRSELESRERLFSLGFFASFTAAIIALVGLFGRIPLIKLERQLKRLEIEERALAIRLKTAELARNAAM